MIDPIVNLAFSMHKTPGLYALLLGSGISKSVGIPTGQEIRDVLVKQVKAISGTDTSEDIGYDELLKQLGKTPAERNAFLKSYFEPTDEERDKGRKIPSPAHHAIAQLIKTQYIKVVLTTNFDRLLEQALENIGLTPNVIRSDAMIEGSTPLVRSPITIVQLHGDYLSSEMLNTPEELNQYGEEKEKLLHRILDEYGLIVCGWSAKWDTALRNALRPSKSPRYSTYWVEPFDLSPEAQDLVKQRKAEVIRKDGDTFFTELIETVDILAKTNSESSRTVSIAVETVKKWLPLDIKRIELEDFIRDTSEDTLTKIKSPNINLKLLGVPSNQNETEELLKIVHSNCEVMFHIAHTLCWYGDGKQSQALAQIAKRWANQAQYSQLTDHHPTAIPILLLMYIGGVAAVHQSNWAYLQSLIDFKIAPHGSQEHVLYFVCKTTTLHSYNSGTPRIDPHSKLLSDFLRPLYQRTLPDDTDFTHSFDLFEMLLCLLSIHRGAYWIRHNLEFDDYRQRYRTSTEYAQNFWSQGAKEGRNWNFLKQFFDGEPTALKETLSAYQNEGYNIQTRFPQRKLPDYATTYSTNLR